METMRTRACECGAADCTAQIAMSWEEQDAVDHSGENLWIIAAGHELRGARGAETILANERYSVVRVEEHE